MTDPIVVVCPNPECGYEIRKSEMEDAIVEREEIDDLRDRVDWVCPKCGKDWNTIAYKTAGE